MIKDVEVRDTATKGKGVFAKRRFAKGKFIFRYKRGKIVPGREIDGLSEWQADHLDELDGDEFEVQPAPACFVNHSCDPNAMAHGRSYFALRAIEKGDEVTVDYRSKGIFKNKWECRCGSKNCKGYVISDFFTLPEEAQRFYLPHTLKIIRQEYMRRQGEK